MAIKQLINTRTPGEIREFQTRMIQLGRIRTGIFETPPGKRGRPAKLDRFRFTSPDRDLIEAVSAEYGGVVEEFKPQGAGVPGWQVTTDADRIPVYIVNGQKIDPTYEAWSAGRRCIRRCDGEWNTIEQAPCVCNGLNPQQRPPEPRDMCKPTTRVNIMLPAVEGIGSWLYESHGENFAIETGGVLATFVASAPVPVPAWFCLEAETRQHRKPEGGWEKRDFYVARFRITAITPEQIALGQDVVTRILTQAGAPAALSGGQRPAIEAAPVSAVPVSAPTSTERPDGLPPGPDAGVARRGAYSGPGPDVEALRPKILADIEKQTTIDGLDAIKDRLKARGINDAQIKGAWASKRAAIVAAYEVAAQQEEPSIGLADVEYRFGDTVTVGGIEFTKIGDDPFNHPFADVREQYDEALARGASPKDILDAGGPIHWLAADDQAQDRAQDTLTEVHEGTVEGGPADDLPMVPAGDYDVTDQLMFLMREAGKKTPPLTTDQATALVRSKFGLPHMGAATGEQIARVVEALKRGLLP